MLEFQTPGTKAAALAGAVSAALMAGALLFQYVGGLPPCPMCHWQRWPHIAAAVIGLGGALLIRQEVLPSAAAVPAALVAVAGLVISGLIGVYHAGVEWGFWEGLAFCGSSGYVPGQDEDFSIVRCDVAAWRDSLLGVSLAGYNALISFGAALLSLALLRRKDSDARR
jgi:disulfide bond formation protein DsbB